MDTIIGGGYSLDDLRGATEKYVIKRTKTWRGACWYKPDIVLSLEYGDETAYQVGEILSCAKEEAEWVLKLLKAAGMQFVFTAYIHEEPEPEDDEDDDEEFDEEGWLAGSENNRRPKSASSRYAGIVGQNYRSLGLLSSKGLRRQKQIIFRDGRSDERVFFPGEEVSIMSHYAATMSEQYEKKTLHQIRLLLKLQIYYLVALGSRE
jgi:hypothetical protein